MEAYSLKCRECGKPLPREARGCESCGGPVEIHWEDLYLRGYSPPRTFRTMWDFSPLLPLRDAANIVTLGEGGTSLAESRALNKALGIEGLLIKDETRNPTASFKDRSASVGVSCAKEAGVTTLVIASDANAGPATAAYASRAGIPCHVLMPDVTAPERLALCAMYGAKVYKVKGTVNDCITIASKMAEAPGWRQVTTAAKADPFQVEGPKTIAYEILMDLNWHVPEWVVSPAGGGGLISSIWKGFCEMKRAERISKLPRICLVQASGCAPIVRAWERGDDPQRVQPWSPEEYATKAYAIGVPAPDDASSALRAVRASGGCAIAVTDDEMEEAVELLARTTGIFAEPAGATPIAALPKLKEREEIRGMVVAVATGGGMKELSKRSVIADGLPILERGEVPDL
ncbi:MAG: threonine synthase [bacterium]